MGHARFAELMRTPDGPPLDDAALAIAAALRPDADLASARAELDELAATCPGPSGAAVAEHLVTNGFEGDTESYHDWRNSCLDLVLDRRRGIPISLSVLMLEVGRRAGAELVGIGMPAHFLVGEPATGRYFDLFHGAAPLDAAAARAVFANVTAGQTPWNDRFLSETTPRAIVIRMLNNLAAGFRARGDSVRFAIVMSLRADIDELADAEHDAITAATAMFN
jgi:regulator of sirC expression with transglutaminase-like and TPR domain